MRWAAIAALVLAFTLPVHGALPPGYGGTLELPGTSALRLPDPRDVRTPLEASLVRAVFDTLYEVRGNAVVPSLAAALPEIADGVATIRLRPGIRRHDRRPLRARDVAQALRRADRDGAAPWLQGIARRNGELDVSAEGELELRFALEGPELPLARRLASTPTAIVLGRGHGTGPFRARLRGGMLHLAQFRAAARGAPYLRGISISPPRDREGELRAFELDELSASWRGAGLYGRSGHAVERHALPAKTPVLLVVHRSKRNRLRALANGIDRQRLARIGLVPASSIDASLPEPRSSGAQTGPLRLLVEQGDRFQSELADALSARFDELGWPTRRVEVAQDRLSATILGNGWDVRIVQVPPPGTGARDLLGATWLAIGEPEKANAVLAGEPLDRHAASLPVVVLGHRNQTLHHQRQLLGVTHDDVGRLRFEGMYFPREEVEVGR